MTLPEAVVAFEEGLRETLAWYRTVMG